MRCTILLVGFLILAVGGATADNAIGFSDLARVSPEGLTRLKDTEFEVFLARVALADAKNFEQQARESLKTVKRKLEIAGRDLKAASNERNAAAADQNPDRLSAADQMVRSATSGHERAARLVRWKERELRVSGLAVALSAADLELADAKRDLARVSLIVTEQVPSAKKYSVAQREKQVSKAHKDYQKAATKVEQAKAESDQLRIEWEQQSGVAGAAGY